MRQTTNQKTRPQKNPVIVKRYVVSDSRMVSMIPSLGGLFIARPCNNGSIQDNTPTTMPASAKASQFVTALHLKKIKIGIPKRINPAETQRKANGKIAKIQIKELTIKLPGGSPRTFRWATTLHKITVATRAAARTPENRRSNHLILNSSLVIFFGSGSFQRTESTELVNAAPTHPCASTTSCFLRCDRTWATVSE